MFMAVVFILHTNNTVIVYYHHSNNVAFAEIFGTWNYFQDLGEVLLNTLNDGKANSHGLEGS